jgi:predicted nucleic acid-binding protein
MSPDNTRPLICDASVTINLLGSGIAETLLRHVGAMAVMAERTFEEIKRHPIKGRDHASELSRLRSEGLLDVKTLDAASSSLFYELISADIPGGLDAGEAATLALLEAMDGAAVCVLDDRKARNLLTRRWPARQVLYTVDLLSHDKVGKAIERSVLADAIYSALVTARMRVPAPKRPWVIDLIGSDRAGKCSSLGSAA